MKYEETVVVPAETYDRANKLLGVPSLKELTDHGMRSLGANTNVNEGILYVKFEDGSSLNYDLRSDESNYWDDVVWTSPDESEDIFLESDYELCDMEFEINGNLYIVRVQRGEQS